MTWTVKITKRALKQINHLPVRVREALTDLIRNIEIDGPVRGNWPNYGKISERLHHCHIRKGRPTYVAIWEVTRKDIRLVEVIYAGTHEKAPY